LPETFSLHVIITACIAVLFCNILGDVGGCGGRDDGDIDTPKAMQVASWANFPDVIPKRSEEVDMKTMTPGVEFIDAQAENMMFAHQIAGQILPTLASYINREEFRIGKSPEVERLATGKPLGAELASNFTLNRHGRKIVYGVTRLGADAGNARQNSLPNATTDFKLANEQIDLLARLQLVEGDTFGDLRRDEGRSAESGANPGDVTDAIVADAPIRAVSIRAHFGHIGNDLDTDSGIHDLVLSLFFTFQFARKTRHATVFFWGGYLPKPFRGCPPRACKEATRRIIHEKK
jgi:hypothetical protein